MHKSVIIALLNRNNRAVEAAMVALFREQTEDEKSDKVTRHSNGRGFNFNHAERGTYYAKWVLSGKTLTGHHLDAARRMATFYARQLGEIAERKKQAKLKGEADRLEAINTFGEVL